MNEDKKKLRKVHKKVKANNNSVQNFLEVEEIKENCVLTTRNEEIYFLQIKPKNLSVLSDSEQEAIILNLANIIREFPRSEILCLDSTQSYETNKQYLNSLAENESNDAIKELDLKDIEYLDEIRISMATSRIFFLVLRQSTSVEDEQKMLKNVNEAIQKCAENNFNVILATKPDIKKMLAIYLEQNIYQDDISDYDGQQYTDELAPDIYDIKNYVDVIAPSIMDFKHPTYYCIGNTYRRTWAVREYAIEYKQLALLKSLGEMGGVTLHIYNRLVTPYEQNRIFDSASRRNRATLFNSKNVNEQVQGKENISGIEKMVQKAFRDKEVFVYCVVYIEMIANSLAELDTLTTRVGAVLNQSNIVPEKLRLQQRDGFVAAMPLGFNIFGKEFERVIPSSSAANLFPVSYSGKTDRTGLFIGKDTNGNSNIITDFDLRAQDKTNGHIAIFGNSGEGKSWLIKLLICIFRQQGKSVYSLDVDNEYADITHGLGGTNLDMMSGKYYINPLEIMLLKSANDNDDPDAPASLKRTTLLSQHIAFLRDFFCVYKPGITDSQLDILEIMLEETYKLSHITDNTDFSRLKSEDYPILSDLYKTVENALNDYEDKAHKGIEMLYEKDDVRKLLLSLRSICIGTDSRFFNGCTNIPNTGHINFVIKGLLSTNENLKNAMYFNIFSFMQHKYFAEGNTVVVVDELHELIKAAIVVDYIRSFMKRGRKKNSDVVVSSQNLDDLMLPGIIEYTRPLFSIPTHTFLAFPGKVDITLFKRTANITDKEYSLISKSKRGHFLYLCGTERYVVKIIAPPYKAALFGTAGGS